jgi:hypothetical protein
MFQRCLDCHLEYFLLQILECCPQEVFSLCQRHQREKDSWIRRLFILISCKVKCVVCHGCLSRERLCNFFHDKEGRRTSKRTSSKCFSIHECLQWSPLPCMTWIGGRSRMKESPVVIQRHILPKNLESIWKNAFLSNDKLEWCLLCSNITWKQ